MESRIRAKKKIIDVSLGREGADLYILNGRIVNVSSGEILEGHNMAISDQHIAYMGPSKAMITGKTEVIDARGAFLLPGYIDPHAHADFWANPLALTPHFLASGTTTIMSDSHDIIAAVGLAGLDFLLKITKNLPLKFYFRLPVSCPPFPELEGDDVVTLFDIEKYLAKEEVLAVGEVTPWTRIISADVDLLARFALAERWDKGIEGHTPGASFDKLNGLKAAGLTSCHESIDAEDARKRLRLGMAVMLRHGSTRSDLKELIGLVTEEPKIETRKVMLTPDWKSPQDLLNHGYMDHLVRLSIELGVPPLTAVQMATLNSASYLRLDREFGSLSPGLRADILLVDDLRQATPRTVIANGHIVIQDQEPVFEISFLPALAVDLPWSSHRKIPESIKASDFFVTAPTSTGQATVPAISIVDKTITQRHDISLPIVEGQICLPSDQDILKISMLNKDSSGFVTSFLVGFRARIGGLASSVSHEHHKPVIIGCHETDMALALQRVKEIRGGFVLAHHGQILKEIPLTIGGIMSMGSLGEVADEIQGMENTLREMGCALESPLFTLSFLSFSALPWIRLTPSGLLDVRNRMLIWP